LAAPRHPRYPEAGFDLCLAFFIEGIVGRPWPRGLCSAISSG
jgi:hypothetical protein